MNVLLVGESWTVHETHIKGADIFNMCKYEDDCGHALANVFSSKQARVTYIPSHKVAEKFPKTLKDLQEFDVVILSDVGSNTFLLCPETFYKGMLSENKLELIKEFVAQGGGLAMIGGYMSFSGIDNKARYAMTPLAEVLPVTMLNYDDRIECPQGIKPVILKPEHPVMKNVDPNGWEKFLGYNKISAKEEAVEIAKIHNDTFIAAMNYGKGKSFAFASDCAPHWARKEFMNWEGYGEFFTNMIEWLAE